MTTPEIENIRAQAFREAATVCEFMIVGGRAWTEEQAVAADALMAAADNIRAYAAGELPTAVAHRIRELGRG